jgi:ABC-type uncharacterized transport system permease subunit
MFAGISILCFTASYALALALEVTRLFFQSGVRGLALVVCGSAGMAAHSLFLVSEFVNRPAGTAPLSSWFHWYLLAAWLLTAAYLWVTVDRRHTAIGVFMLPLVLVLIGVAWWFRDEPPFPIDTAYSLWGRIHGATQLAGSVAVMVGFIAGLMYIVQSARLKRKRPPRKGLRLPSLELLARINAQSLLISTALLGVGALSGVILNLVKHVRDVERFAWNDPVVWTSSVLFGWLLAALAFSGVYKPARQGRKVAYLTVASFVFLMFVLATTLLFSEHATQAGAGSTPQISGYTAEGTDEGTNGRL